MEKNKTVDKFGIEDVALLRALGGRLCHDAVSSLSALGLLTEVYKENREDTAEFAPLLERMGQELLGKIEKYKMFIAESNEAQYWIKIKEMINKEGAAKGVVVQLNEPLNAGRSWERDEDLGAKPQDWGRFVLTLWEITSGELKSGDSWAWQQDSPYEGTVNLKKKTVLPPYTQSQKECRAGGSEHRHRAVINGPLKPSTEPTNSESCGEWGYSIRLEAEPEITPRDVFYNLFHYYKKRLPLRVQIQCQSHSWRGTFSLEDHN